MIKDASTLAHTNQHGEQSSSAAILYTMTTCHSLKIVADEIIGDPLDAKMFEFTEWTFEEGGKVYEYVTDEDLKENEETGLMFNRNHNGKYVVRDATEREGFPSVRPPQSADMVICPLKYSDGSRWNCSC